MYFQTNDIHHQILEDLEASIRVMATGRTRDEGGYIITVIQYLMDNFGGNMQDYKYWKCGPTTFRIQLPHALSRYLVLENSRRWGEQNGWTMTDWDPYVDARIQEKPFRVRVKITQFPEEFWHPFFIQQVVAQFGDLELTDGENITGHNHRSLGLWVRCIDPRRIPYYTDLPYGRLWKECIIQVITWEYMGEMPPDPSPMPPGDSSDRYGSEGGQTEYYVRRSMTGFHDRIMNWRRAQPSSPEPSSDSNQTDMGETDTWDAPDKKKGLYAAIPASLTGGPNWGFADKTVHNTREPSPCEFRNVEKKRNWENCITRGHNGTKEWSKGSFTQVAERKTHRGTWSPYKTPSLQISIEVGSITVISQGWGTHLPQMIGHEQTPKSELEKGDGKNEKRTVMIRVGQWPICLIKTGPPVESQKKEASTEEQRKRYTQGKGYKEGMGYGLPVSRDHTEKEIQQSRIEITVGSIAIYSHKIGHAKIQDQHAPITSLSEGKSKRSILGPKKQPLNLSYLGNINSKGDPGHNGPCRKGGYKLNEEGKIDKNQSLKNIKQGENTQLCLANPINLPKSLDTKNTMEQTDEELLAKFAALHTAGGGKNRLI